MRHVGPRLSRAPRLPILSPEGHRSVVARFVLTRKIFAGCTLAAVVETDAAGRSDARALGRVVRLPRITGFTLTDEKVGESAYAGLLTGSDLEMIERAGWDTHTGLAVDNLPKPVAGERDRQTLRVALPWPAPAPHAPVCIWLRGEPEGRVTRAKL